jgi:putative glutamine amidotransferase
MSPKGSKSRPLRIAISSAFSRPYEERRESRGKTLAYASLDMAAWIAGAGALPLLALPAAPAATLGDLCDALVLQGGPDLGADPERDRSERELLAVFLAARKPVFGICRGLQLINVAFGGTLIGDLPTALGSHQHREGSLYDDQTHGIRILPESRLARLYPEVREARVNSLHHQAIATLGRGLCIEALADEDAVIEAVRLVDPTRYVFATQWHPEFTDRRGRGCLDAGPLLEDFLRAAREIADARRADRAPVVERGTSDSSVLL